MRKTEQLVYFLNYTAGMRPR